ncbi:MAG: hypothetical protein ACI9W4_001445 [Rhodothermales bacterium]|jgi:hypothetical protein
MSDLPDRLAAIAAAHDHQGDLGEFFRRVLALVAAGIVRNWGDLRDALRSATVDFLEGSGADIARWSGLMASGAIDRADYDTLIRARAALGKMEALTLAGMSRGQISKFRALLVESVVATALMVLVGGTDIPST